MAEDVVPRARKHLYIFLDEGGDLDFSPSGSKYFTLTSVAKARPFRIAPRLDALKYDLIEHGLEIEHFHATNDRQAVRDRVFDIIAAELPSLRIDSLIVEKSKTGPALRDVLQFYPRMLGYLLRYLVEHHPLEGVDEVVVITDSIPVQRKRKAFEKAVKMTLKDMLPNSVRFRAMHHASKSTFGLQVADYCNWAIFRKWERGDARSYEVIKSRVASEFDIFRGGTTYYYEK
jgi:hypothetical protein